MSYVYLGLNNSFLRLQEDGQTLDLVDVIEGATAFPTEVIEEITEALKQHGITEELTQTPAPDDIEDEDTGGEA